MTLANNVNNLFIPIPNEGHHDEGEAIESRFLERDFVPNNAIINTGTIVSWFSGDVGNERTINDLNMDGNSLFNTGKILDSQVSTSYTFANPGTYKYKAEGDPGVTMEGTITEVDDNCSNTSTSSGNLDTVGVVMITTRYR
jgi:plastocyanin